MDIVNLMISVFLFSFSNLMDMTRFRPLYSKGAGKTACNYIKLLKLKNLVLI